MTEARRRTTAQPREQGRRQARSGRRGGRSHHHRGRGCPRDQRRHRRGVCLGPVRRFQTTSTAQHLVTTQLGNEAGAPIVPNVLTAAASWDELSAAAEKAGLGDELVVQTPYGNSGKTTFFISWRRIGANTAPISSARTSR